MLSKKRQRQYLTEKEQQWEQELAAFGASRDEEALHRLRLGIKKIRAMVRLSEGVRGKRLEKDFRPLKKMFRHAGMIRDARSELRLLEEHHLLSPAFKERRDHQIQAAADKFARQVKNYRKKGKKAGRLLLADLQSMRGGRIRRWFADEIIQIGILLTRSGDEWHTARKKIKTLLYVQKALPEKMAAALQLNREYLDDLQDTIGKWHDTVVAAADLHHLDADGENQLSRDCRDREQAIRLLAANFYRKVHK